jgi:hydrogenase nickel insertion protein HypA
MSQIVATILEESRKNKLENIAKVELEIGELTFLAHEQLKFAYQIITERTKLAGSKLIIKERKAKVLCKNCNYKGSLNYDYDESYHFSLPRFSCPNCDGEIKIIKGMECIIKRITGESNVQI